MANLTDAEEDRLLDLTLPPAGGVYLALFTAAPGEAGGGTEVAAAGYERTELKTTAASGGSKANSEEILYPVAEADWGTITGYGVIDASTGGTMRWHRTLAENEQREILEGDQYRVRAETLTFTLD